MDTKSYIEIRNKTLLFFIEKLIERPRTLHDLSCQFGSRGFSREMRQIAGGSQSGLKKFLSTYPSLFQIHSSSQSNVNTTTTNNKISSTAAAAVEDEIEVVIYKDFDETGEGSKLSFESLAVEYFRSCLLQYGYGCTVPVKSLLGHRSQANLEVRHVSGQHTSEFKEFLQRNPSVFKMSECTEFIKLTEFSHLPDCSFIENINNLQGGSNNHLIGQSEHGIDNNNLQLVDNMTSAPNMKPGVEKSNKSHESFSTVKFIYDCIESKGPMLVDQLFNLILHSEQNINKDFIKCPNDLATFIRFHQQCFNVSDHLITFAEQHKIGLEYLKIQLESSALLNKQQQQQPLPLLTWSEDDESESDRNLASFSSTSTTTDDVLTPGGSSGRESNTTSPNINQKQNNFNTNSNQQPQPLMSLKVSPPPLLEGCDFKSKSNTIKTTKSVQQGVNDTVPVRPGTSSVGNKNTLKERLNRAILSNLSGNHSISTSSSFQNNTSNNNSISDNNVITNLNMARKIVKNILSSIEKKDYNGVTSLDCEGFNLGQDGNLTLVQLGLPTGSVYIFDILMNPEMIHELSKIMTNQDIVKVMHDCRNDSVNLYNQFGIKLVNVFDTQVGQYILSDGKNYNLNKLCELYGLKGNEFKDKIKNLYRSDNRFWMRRPLSQNMIQYAIHDVFQLINIYYKMKDAIENSSNPKVAELFNDSCNDQVLALIEPNQIKSKKRLLKNEADLQELKAKLESLQNHNNNNIKSYNYNYNNIVLSNREIRLLKHLQLTESQIDLLKRSNLKIARKLNSFQERIGSISQQDEQQLLFQALDNNLNSNQQVLMNDRVPQHHISSSSSSTFTTNLNSEINLPISPVYNVVNINNNDKSSQLIENETQTMITETQSVSTQT